MNLDSLQQALYDRLYGATVIGGVWDDATTWDDASTWSDWDSPYLAKAVYSSVPQPNDANSDADFPYVTISNMFPTPWDTDDTRGASVVVQIGVWTRTHSDIERRQLESTIINAIHRFDATISGVNTVDCLFESATEIDDPDGKTKHGVLSFRVTYDSVT